MKGSALRHVHRVLDQYEPTPDNQPSALDWLARQRAEAVAAWIEKQVAENLERYGTHYYERTTDDLMREAAAFRAAALRAGEVDND
jgi:cation diffusion facilitator CzcD-associated flavoprotein CzcO